MHSRRILLCLLFFLFALPCLAQDEKASVLRVKIECEEPSGVLHDSDTLQTARAALFSIHVFNQTEASRIVTLSWKITDAAGKEVVDNKEKYTLPAGQHVTRRELFAAKSRGAFLLSAKAESRTDGPDLKDNQTFPFTILSAPPENMASRRPLVLVDAPLQMSDADLIFYNRIGAHALRSTLLDSAPDPSEENASHTDFHIGHRPDWKLLDSALQARVARGIGTVGVLNAPPRSALSDDEEWLQFALSLLTRYRTIVTWEIIGRPSLDTLNELSRAARNMNPPRSILASAPRELQNPGSRSEAAMRLRALDGLIFWPPSNAGNDLHPAALRRALLARRDWARELGTASFHLRETTRSGRASTLPAAATPLEAANELVMRAVLSMAAGATGSSAALDEGGAHRKFARGAAFAALSNLLGDANFHSEAFPQSRRPKPS